MVSCTSRLFQVGVREKLVREITAGQKSKLCFFMKRLFFVSLDRVNDTRRTNVDAIENVVGLEKRKAEVNCSTSTAGVDTFYLPS